jgi:hypothetical protein
MHDVYQERMVVNLKITLVPFDPLLPDPCDLAHARGLQHHARAIEITSRIALVVSVAVLVALKFHPATWFIAAALAVIRARVKRRISRLRTRARKLQLGHASSVARKRT